MTVLAVAAAGACTVGVLLVVTWARVVADASRHMQSITDHHKAMAALGRLTKEEAHG